MIAILIIAGVFFALYLIHKFFKVPKCGNLVLVTGGIKMGKSTFAVWLAFVQLRLRRLKVWILNHVLHPILGWLPFIGKKFAKRPRPLLYSNIPLNVPYVPVTKDLLLRKSRFVYGSVIYLCESSLVADSMSFKDEIVNEELLLFNKLIGHETKGGILIYDTQSVSDNHYAIKRCLNSYFYIHHKVVIPFFLILYVREMIFSEDNNAVNAVNEDVEVGLRRVIVPKRAWKLFDCYCYSALTDDLPVEQEERIATTLKCTDIVSFKDFKVLKKKQEIKTKEVKTNALFKK